MKNRFSHLSFVGLFSVTIASLIPSSLWGQSPTSLSPSWVQHYGAAGYGNPDNSPVAVAVGNSGSVYSLYVSSTTFTERDYVLLKYNSSGVQEWLQRYDGPGHSADIPVGIVTDAQENIYVTGTSKGDSTGNDICTIKYSPTGSILWLRRYDEPSNGDEVAVAMVIDNNGNICIAGNIIVGCCADSYLTLKYDSNGNLIWARTFRSEVGSWSTATSIAADSSGNVFVTGTTLGQRTTVKYSLAGDTLWTASISFAGESVGPIVADASGNVYIAGDYRYYWYDTEMYVVKYSPSGTELWTRPIPGVPGRTTTQFRGMTIDPAGSIYVTGTSWGWDANVIVMETAKCDPSGYISWTRFSNSGARDESYFITVDKSFYIYVAGYGAANVDYLVLQYDANGTLRWTGTYNGPGNFSSDEAVSVAAGRDGSVYAVGWSLGDNYEKECVTVAFSSTGRLRWNVPYIGENLSNDRVVGATWSNGLCVVTAVSSGIRLGTGNDILTLAYTTEGTRAWTARYSDSTFDQSPTAVRADGSGNVYVVGVGGHSTGSNALTLKYDHTGQSLWTKNYCLSTNTTNNLNDATFDRSGNIVVTGSSNFERGRFLTLKYNDNGTALLDLHEFVPWNDWPVANSVALDNSGNIYITGSVWRSDAPPDPNTTLHYATLKYNAEGTNQWGRYNTGLSPYNGQRKIIVDSTGNIYIAGTSQLGNSTAITTIKYDSNGTLQWVATIDGGRNVVGLFLDPQGRILVGGTAPGIYGSAFIVACYNVSGGQRWRAMYDAEPTWHGGNDDEANAMAMDPFGYFYVTGGSDLYTRSTVKFSPNGAIVWIAKYRILEGQSRTEDGAIVLDESGNVYVAASTTFSSSKFVNILKYQQPATAVQNGHAQLPSMFSLSQNYPNPFNPSTTIRYELPRASHVMLTVYDVLGREVATLVNGVEEPGYKSVKWDAGGVSSGVYFYRIQAGDFVQTKKLLLLR